MAPRKKKQDLPLPSEGTIDSLVHYTDEVIDTEALKSDINALFNEDPATSVRAINVIVVGKVTIKDTVCYRVLVIVTNSTNTVGVQALDVRPDVMTKYLVG